jgi:hypothetical protein
MSGDKSHLNGSKDSNGKGNSRTPGKGSKDKDGDSDMTVIVPPAKGSTPSAPSKTTEADMTNGNVDGDKEADAPVDPQQKAIDGKKRLQQRVSSG